MATCPKPKTPTQLDAECARFNSRHPVGTEVLYLSTLTDQTGKRTKTRGEAFVLGSHTAAVMLEGVSGAVALSHVKTLEG